ncbi:methyl-accepting chemotaxis protein [Pseudoalteromonas xiamenensis]|uniref:methyl-accepting chemotaxis protein n=1 Tax=Pseudoalteromonas xiamenensis TaxID=882626 RepID=UPI0027E51B2F|nr:methyl-accepting chemotaxis protein [Pseudoalteromonas xiamenensis]WMN60864.1 methyl-accepting chemotaxis protein [Pseudoalteromonas xiamenensis]
MNLNRKVSLLVGCLVASSLIGGGVSFFGFYKLNVELQFITGPGWNASDGAMESTIEIQSQIRAIQNYMTHYAELNPDYAREQLTVQKESHEKMLEAYKRMLDSGLIAEEDVQGLSHAFEQFERAEQQVLSSYKDYAQKSTDHRTIFANFQSFMTELEEVGDGAVEYLEQNPSEAVSWQDGLSERWSAADGGMEAQIALLQMQYFLQEYFSSGGKEEDLNHYTSAQSDFAALTKEIAQHPLFIETKSKDSNRSFAALIKEHDSQFAKNNSELMRSWKSYTDNLAVFNNASELFLKRLEKVEALADAKVEDESDIIQHLRNYVASILVISMLVTVFISILAGIGVNRFIVRPVKNMAKVLDENPNNLAIKLDDSQQDEIGMLCASINRAYSSQANALSKIEMGTYLVECQSTLLQHSAEVTSEEVNQQEADTEQSAFSIQQMAQSIKHLCESAQSASLAANQALNTATEGHQSVSFTKNQIHALFNNMEKMSTAILNLNKDTEKIATVVEVIGNIAEQTNLLALNAAIEAARAGEQGRGFAVVADEVRTLASRTQKSTQEIQITINSLLSSTQGVVNAMQQSSAQSQETVKQIDETDKTLTGIVELVSQINDINSHMAATTEQQSATSEDIANNLVNISNSAKETLNAVKSVMMVSNGLSQISNNLNSQVNQFKIIE